MSGAHRAPPWYFPNSFPFEEKGLFSHCFQELAFTLLLYIRYKSDPSFSQDSSGYSERSRAHPQLPQKEQEHTIFSNFQKSYIKNKGWYRMCHKTWRNGITI
uniref:Uncharacterized protein n=1 Tax=Ombrophytum subterraneum TaxID=50155 RepID=A0A6M8PH59_9MAGN|nr:hypothetical protein [Ombrophytum subterraneum]